MLWKLRLESVMSPASRNHCRGNRAWPIAQESGSNREQEYETEKGEDCVCLC